MCLTLVGRTIGRMKSLPLADEPPTLHSAMHTVIVTARPTSEGLGITPYSGSELCCAFLTMSLGPAPQDRITRMGESLVLARS